MNLKKYDIQKKYMQNAVIIETNAGAPLLVNILAKYVGRNIEKEAANIKADILATTWEYKVPLEFGIRYVDLGHAALSFENNKAVFEQVAFWITKNGAYVDWHTETSKTCVGIIDDNDVLTSICPFTVLPLPDDLEDLCHKYFDSLIESTLESRKK